MYLSPLSSLGRVAQVARPQVFAPGQPCETASQATDEFVASPSPAVASLPATAEKSPKTARRQDYLWEGAAIGGWMGAVLGAVVSFGPMPKLLGLEPPPARDPKVSPLGFDWNALDDKDFAAQCKALESALERGTEVGKKKLGGGGNRSYLVELDTGPVAVWKPKAGQKPGKSRNQLHPNQNEGKVEAAAYLVDRALGHLARVPPASSSGLEGREGTLCLYLPQTTPAKDLGERDMLYSLLKPEDTRRITLFDHVIGNLDRHGGNWLIDPKGRPIPIDHGLAFPLGNENQGFHNFDFSETFMLNPEETARLQQFTEQRPEIEGQLQGLLSSAAVDAMFERVEKMLQSGSICQQWRSDPVS